MKQQIENLIESLADKSLTFGQKVEIDLNEGKYTRNSSIVIVQVGYFYPELFGEPYFCEGLCPTASNALQFKYLDTERKLKGRAWRQIHRVLGHPILIGDVLEKMKAKNICNDGNRKWLVENWYHCGFTKSLQDILLRFDAEIEDEEGHHILPHPAMDLFEFLLSLNLTK